MRFWLNWVSFSMRLHRWEEDTMVEWRECEKSKLNFKTVDYLKQNAAVCHSFSSLQIETSNY